MTEGDSDQQIPAVDLTGACAANLIVEGACLCVIFGNRGGSGRIAAAHVPSAAMFSSTADGREVLGLCPVMS